MRNISRQKDNVENNSFAVEYTVVIASVDVPAIECICLVVKGSQNFWHLSFRLQYIYLVGGGPA